MARYGRNSHPVLKKKGFSCCLFMDVNNNVLKNYMEVIVFETVDSVMENLGGCCCDVCKLDTVAIALNSLPAKYVVTSKGELYTKFTSFQSQFEVDVIAALTYAAEKVKAKPRH